MKKTEFTINCLPLCAISYARAGFSIQMRIAHQRKMAHKGIINQPEGVLSRSQAGKGILLLENMPRLATMTTTSLAVVCVCMHITLCVGFIEEQ